MSTKIAIHEYGATTQSYSIANLPATASVWDDCVTAINIAGFRPQQFPLQTIRAPGAWSSPGTNVDNAAASQAFAAGVLASPHVHGGQGPGHRAAIGCRVVLAGANYQFMKIYIGQFS